MKHLLEVSPGQLRSCDVVSHRSDRIEVVLRLGRLAQRRCFDMIEWERDLQLDIPALDRPVQGPLLELRVQAGSQRVHGVLPLLVVLRARVGVQDLLVLRHAAVHQDDAIHGGLQDEVSAVSKTHRTSYGTLYSAGRTDGSVKWRSKRLFASAATDGSFQAKVSKRPKIVDRSSLSVCPSAQAS